MHLEGLMVADQQGDTLLYAGDARVNITDWFFFKKNAELKYIGLNDAVVKFQRTDSVWSQQFLFDFFGGSSSGSNKKSGMELNLKKAELNNVTFLQKDKWHGHDMTIHVGALDLDVRQFSLSQHQADISAIHISRPMVWLSNYNGLDTLNSYYKPVDVKEAADSLLKWNRGGWSIHADMISITDGIFRNDKQSAQPGKAPFDGKHIEFSKIQTSLVNVNWIRDTITTKLSLTTTERSGLEVKKMESLVKFTPQEMAFNELDLQTNRSTLRHYFRMSYDDMSSLDDFIHKVNLQADFNGATVSSDDIAFFAPALKKWNKTFLLSGKIHGTIDALKGKEMLVRTGAGTLLDGDISLTGLPYINETFIDLKANDFKTTFGDAVSVVPAMRRVTSPDLRRLQYVRFRGNFAGFIRDFVTFGTIETALGTVKSDLNMKLPAGKEPVYSGSLITDNFRLGEFLADKNIGTVALNVTVKGSGISSKKRNTLIDGTIGHVDYKGYRYQQIAVKGRLDKNLFSGNASMNDPNAELSMNGTIDFNSSEPVFRLKGDIQKAALKNMGLTEDDLSFHGKLNLDFSGNSLDNFNGTARISLAEFSRNGKPLPFDSLTITTSGGGKNKLLSVSSNEFKADITGDYNLKDLPDAFSFMLSKYYPSYIKAPSQLPRNQQINFDISTYYADEYMQLIHPKLSGFNNSRFKGKLDLYNNELYMEDSIQQFSWGQYNFEKVRLLARGNMNNLVLSGEAKNFRLNDSLSFPLVQFSITARNDSSHVTLNTGATQAVEKASINAWVVTGKESIDIGFEPSNFTVNGKTWTIDTIGQKEHLVFRRGNPLNGQITLTEGNQKIAVRTTPSAIKDRNNLVAELTNINLGDFGPYLLPHNRLEGILSGTFLVENLSDSLHISSRDIRTRLLQLDNDSLGEVQAIGDYDRLKKQLSFSGNTLNKNNYLGFNGNIFIGDPLKAANNLIKLEAKRFEIKVLERFLGTLFSDMKGYLTGNVDLSGDFKNLAVGGKGRLEDAGLKVNFTQCFYKIKDADIELTPEEIKLDGLELTDTVTGHPIYVSGGIEHQAFRNMFYNIYVRTEPPKVKPNGEKEFKPVLLLNTSIKDNKQFYGRVFGTGSFSLNGPQSEMFMDIDVLASEKDSSNIVIPPSSSRESGLADFLVERKFGHEMYEIDQPKNVTNVIYNVKLTATPAVNAEVQIDELTGDIIKGRGRGTLNIISGTSEPLQMRGRFDIDEGNYLFTFQSFFKRPFELKKGSNNYIEWTGDPYDARINLDAVYTARNVSYAPLNTTKNLASNISGAFSDVYVVASLTDKLFKPKIDFSLDFPAGSTALNDPGLAFSLQQLHKDPNEMNKQATYLVVFGSFAPLGTYGSTGYFQEIAANSLSGIFFNVINEQVKKILVDFFKLQKYTFTFNSSVYNRNPIEQGAGFNIGSNVNATIGRSFFNNRVIVSVGGTFEGIIQGGQTNTLSQTRQSLLNANLEILLNPSGSFRANLFFRQNSDYLTSSSTGPGRADKWGAGVSYRKDAGTFWGLFFKKKKKDSTQGPPETPLQPAKKEDEPGHQP